MSVNKRKWKDKKTGETKNSFEVHVVFRTLAGKKLVVRRKSPVQTQRGSEKFERVVRQALADGTYEQARKEETTIEVPTFEKWFNGRFWKEWVIAERNKPSEQESKLSIYKCHLKAYFGHLRLDEVANKSRISQFKASLMERVDAGTLSLKSVNNILAVLSKAIRYGEEAGVIEHAPQVKPYKVERTETKWWEFEEYARILESAKREGPEWYVAACLAGETGLRIGEVRALLWESDVDLVAKTITVNKQTRHGITGSPKGRTRRTISMTTTLLDAITGLDVVRRGYVARNSDGSPLTDNQTKHIIYRICRGAGLPERGWHTLRHTFGTHSALFGVNPWSLMEWMGHKTITETMRYVHVAKNHRRQLPEPVLLAGQGPVVDPDDRIVLMLSARRTVGEQGGSSELKPARSLYRGRGSNPYELSPGGF